MDYKITMVLDKRRQLINGKYPIKVRVWSSLQRKAFRITTGITAKEGDFNKSWGITPAKSQSLKDNLRELNLVIDTVYRKALDSASSMNFFDIDEFERKLFRKASDKESISYHFDRVISELTEKGRIGAASSYRCTKVSLMKYENQRTRSPKDSLLFYEVTPKWLYDYENYMIDENKRSLTTVAIYARTLKAVFNRAINQNDLEKKHYPFGKGKYEIPQMNKVKKTLSREQVELFYHSKLPQLQDRARDYWFFSYGCSGMNFKDIAMLKYENLKENNISYYREKTKVKKRTNKKKISFPLNKVTQNILDKYKTEYTGESDYIFPILKEGDSAEVIFKKVNNFIRSINQQLKHIAKKHKFPEGFSTYWARHSYATNMINMGASIEFVSEALNHSDISVTQNYFDGFEDKAKKEFTDKLMDF